MCLFRLQELQRSASREGEEDENEMLDVAPVFLQYPLPYQPDVPSPLLVAHRPTELMFGNPYSTESRGQCFVHMLHNVQQLNFK